MHYAYEFLKALRQNLICLLNINQLISLLCNKAGYTIHINVRQVKVDLYKFTLPALSAP